MNARGLATVTVLRRHNNEFGDAMDKVPADELGDRKDAVAEYTLPLGFAHVLAQLGLIRIDVPPAEEDAPVPAKVAKRRS